MDYDHKPPNVGPVHISHRVIVTVELSPLTGTVLFGTGAARFAPKHLTIEYINGRLYQCFARGPKVRADGHEFIDGSYAQRSFVKYDAPNKRKQLSERAPDWVAELVFRYAPEHTATTVTGNGVISWPSA
jgi:hypothetical protein